MFGCALVWTVCRVEIIFCADLWELWGVGDFLPERTAVPFVEAESGNAPVMLLAFLDTDMWETSQLILATNEKFRFGHGCLW